MTPPGQTTETTGRTAWDFLHGLPRLLFLGVGILVGVLAIILIVRMAFYDEVFHYGDNKHIGFSKQATKVAFGQAQKKVPLTTWHKAESDGFAVLKVSTIANACTLSASTSPGGAPLPYIAEFTPP